MAHAFRMTRRAALKTAASAAALPLVHVRSAGAAGKLTGAMWNHFVPGFPEAFQRIVDEWAAKTKTDLRFDFLGFNAVEASEAEEAHAGVGHDFRGFFGSTQMHDYAERLEPMNDLIELLTSKYGALPPIVEYKGKVDGIWRGVPGSPPSPAFPCCTRMDLFRQHVGMDVQAVFPTASRMGAGYDDWTWDAFLAAAEKCAKAGFPFGLPLGQTGDFSVWVGAVFRGFGAELVDATGKITVKSDNVRQAIDYVRRLTPFLPPEIYSWDEASNNRALITGRSALIVNPPTAWAAALRDNPPVGQQIWHHPMPAGRHGRFIETVHSFWGVWSFSRNKSAAKELILWLAERQQVERICAAAQGNQLPAFTSMCDFPIWTEIGPPHGTLYNFPVKPQHHAQPTIVGWPAPLAIATQILNQATMPKMIARITQGGMSMEQSIAIAERELEGFRR